MLTLEQFYNRLSMSSSTILSIRLLCLFFSFKYICMRTLYGYLQRKRCRFSRGSAHMRGGVQIPAVLSVLCRIFIPTSVPAPPRVPNRNVDHLSPSTLSLPPRSRPTNYLDRFVPFLRPAGKTISS